MFLHGQDPFRTCLLFPVAPSCCDAQRAAQLDLSQTKAAPPVASIELLQLEEKHMPKRLLQILLLATIALLAARLRETNPLRLQGSRRRCGHCHFLCRCLPMWCGLSAMDRFRWSS